MKILFFFWFFKEKQLNTKEKISSEISGNTGKGVLCIQNWNFLNFSKRYLMFLFLLMLKKRRKKITLDGWDPNKYRVHHVYEPHRLLLL